MYWGFKISKITVLKQLALFFILMFLSILSQVTLHKMKLKDNVRSYLEFLFFQKYPP